MSLLQLPSLGGENLFEWLLVVWIVPERAIRMKKGLATKQTESAPSKRTSDSQRSASGLPTTRPTPLEHRAKSFHGRVSSNACDGRGENYRTIRSPFGRLRRVLKRMPASPSSGPKRFCRKRSR